MFTPSPKIKKGFIDMDMFLEVLKCEILTQKRLLKESLKIEAEAPAGHLAARKRKTATSLYHVQKKKTASGWKNVSRAIKNNPDLLHTLIKKRLAQETRRLCRRNLPALERALEKYQSPYDLINALPENYQSVLTLLRKEALEKWESAPYKKAPFDPNHHIHETLCGELVRSKSEVIIANALFTYGIPFHFEEQFPYPNENGDFYYPDFTIFLPDESRIIWEHLGMLSVMSYAVHNGQKLHTYQTHDFLIGKNLILTQDDSRGNCSSSFIYHIIERALLPHFSDIGRRRPRI